MSKRILAIVLTATLIASPVVPIVASVGSAQTPPATTQAKPKAPSGGAAAMRERQKKCGAEWKAAKAAGGVEKGQTWPKFWSACNKRLKSAS